MSLRQILSCVLALTVLSVAPTGARQEGLEYDVKAAFLLNFGRYVQWPTQPPGSFQLCVLASNPFGARLEAAVAGEMWHDKTISVRQVQDAGNTRECHLLFVPADATPRFLAANTKNSRAVLTVGETRQFLLQGGMIQLFLDNNKVRFSINQNAAEAAGLQISSRLLRLAREVIGQAPVP